ncbi:hypothetical protein Pst134EB_028642 [Puccinia striiformis f. sp. tritici]|nr:hypothetical protein Pst134EB_028642 [Puccinia striiformis f. sp. tritici]
MDKGVQVTFLPAANDHLETDARFLDDRKNVNSKFNRTALRLSLLLFHCALEASFEEVLGVNGISSLLPMSAAGLVKHIPDIKVNCTIYLFCIHSKRKPFCLSQQQHCSNS